MKNRLRVFLPVLFVAGLVSAGPCQASLTLLWSTSGSGINGEPTGNGVHDSVSGGTNIYYVNGSPNTLVIDLFNTTSGGTRDSADVLVGLAFSLSGISGTLANGQLISPSLTTQKGTSTELGGSKGDADFLSTWKTASPVGKSLGDYGVSTNGFNGAFNGKGLKNQNNGVVATGTSLSSGGPSNKTPLAMNGIELTLAFSSGTDFSASGVGLTGLKLLFGTSGAGVIDDPPDPISTPEPSTIALALSGLGMLSVVGLLRRRRGTEKDSA